MFRAGLAAVMGAMLIAADEPPERDYPDPPAPVSERIVDGRFEPGDFSYLRGAYPGANADEVSEWQSVKSWLDQCGKEGTQRLNAEMEALGVQLDGEFISGAASLCQQVITLERLPNFDDFDGIRAALPGARKVFNTLVEVIRLTKPRIGSIEQSFVRELEARTLDEQLLRLSVMWGPNADGDPRRPELREDEFAWFRMMISGELARVDFENTQWLKGQVDVRGWPTLSTLGERASRNAWLLTQHADHDPAFQLRALRLMEPLVAQGEVSKRNFAYLYDRIMLKLKGKQRYATQVACEGGERIARPLEEPERVEQLRAEMDLEPFAEYLTWFSGKC